MLRTRHLALLVGAALFASPAFAQTQTGQTQSGTAAQSAGQSINFLTQQSANQWRAYKMIGANVYDPQDRKIGDVKDILLDKNGNAEAVVIGVGGFLGLGAKNIAVPFKSLDWKMEPMRTVSPGPSGPPATVRRGTETTGMGGGSASATFSTASSSTPDYPDHAVMSLTKDEAKNAPDFHFASSAASTSDTPRGASGTQRR